jgi:hypothetical protein
VADYHLLDAIPTSEHASVADFSSTFDVTAAFNAMMAESGTKRVFLPHGRICVSGRVYGANSTDIVANRTEIFSLAVSDGGHPYHATFWFEEKNDWNIKGRLRINGNRANRKLVYDALGLEGAVVIAGGEQFAMEDAQIVNHPGDAMSFGPHSGASNSYGRAKVGFFKNVIMEGCGRAGISFAGAYDLTFMGCRTRNHVHNSPKSGLAFEPHTSAFANENIQFFGHSSVGNGLHDVYATDGYGPNIGIRFFGGRVPKLFLPDTADVQLFGTLRS